MVVSCPACAARLSLPEEAARNPGRKVLCPRCQDVFALDAGVAAASGASGASGARRAAEGATPAGGTAAPRTPPVQLPPPRVPPVRRPLEVSDAPIDPVATRRMTPEELPYAAELDPGNGPASLEEALAGALPSSAERYQVDRPDYQGATFDIDELADLVKRGWLDRTDGTRLVGEQLWIDAAAQPGLKRAFSLRQKIDQQKASTSAGKGVALVCANHSGKRATLACPGCSRFFCAECSNESELRQKRVALCVECDRPMTAI